MSLTKVTYSMIYSEVTNVKDFGAKGDGVTDDTAAIQAAADYVRNAQEAEIDSLPDYKALKTCVLYFPEGNYIISDEITLWGLFVVRGVGNAWMAGSTISQITPDKNIFNCYWNGGQVEGMNFCFPTAIASSGMALNFPALSPNGSVPTQTSIIIRNNGFGRLGPYGGFIQFHHGDDIEISGNTVDVCDAREVMVFGEATDLTGAKVTNARITNNGFYNTQAAIGIRNGENFIVSNNYFSESYRNPVIYVGAWANDTPYTIYHLNPMPSYYMNGNVFTNNVFRGVKYPMIIDGGSNQMLIDGNSFDKVSGTILTFDGGYDITFLDFTNNIIKTSLQPNGDPFAGTSIISGYPSIVQSNIYENKIDATETATLVTMLPSLNGSGNPFVSVGNQITDNIWKNNPDTANNFLLPFNNFRTDFTKEFSFGGTYPTNEVIYRVSNNDTFSSASYNIAYSVYVSKAATDTVSCLGTANVKISNFNNASWKSSITTISELKDYDNSVGNVPTVTLSIDSSTGSLLITVTSAISSPDLVFLTMRINEVFGNNAYAIPV